MKELYAALAKAQGEFAAIPKNKEVRKKGFSKKTGKEFEYSYWYADWDTITEYTRPILSKNGLSFTQEVYDNICFTHIQHDSGQTATLRCPVIVPQTDMQEIGSALTYAKRYGFSLAFGIATDDDLDANELQGEPYNVTPRGLTQKKQSAPYKPRTNATEAAGFPSTTASEINLPPAQGFVRQYPLSQAQVKRLYAIANNSKWPAAYANGYVLKEFNKKVPDLDRPSYDKACAFFEANQFNDEWRGKISAPKPSAVEQMEAIKKNQQDEELPF